MAWGYFQKVVIADRLAIFVNAVYNNPREYRGLTLIVATVFFAFQIFCDFSGYTDIARGAAKVMGFDITVNFRRPYFAKSIRDFWHRWHISLTTWFRDYLYIPLGGSHCGKWRCQYNVLLVFFLSGVWHGANWTFVIWGILHGFYFLFSYWSKNIRKNLLILSGLDKKPFLLKCLQIIVTFSLVNFAWIFFRANTISDALYISGHLFSGLGEMSNFVVVKASLSGLGLSDIEFVTVLLCIIVMQGIHLLQRNKNIIGMLSSKPIWIRWSAYYGLIFAILFLGVFGRKEFIYFQF
jgi:D-alanyl-lipoteichoic acid acyltransferase DltB (MBOAT superfamily)